MRISYINSNNQEISLINKPYMMLAESSLFNYNYNYNTNSIGDITEAYQEVAQSSVKIAITGETDNIFNRNLDNLVELLNVDVRKNKKGKIIVNNYFLEGFFLGSVKPPKYLMARFAIVEFTFVSKGKNWTYIEDYSFSSEEEIESAYLDYPYDYPYDFKKSIRTGSIQLDGYSNADYELTIYGNCINPIIAIGDWNYGVEGEIRTGERIVLNSKTGKITKYLSDGTTENWFSRRLENFDFTEKIKIGSNAVSWNGVFSFDLSIYNERIEPRWSEELAPLPTITGLDANKMIEMIIGEINNGRD